MQLQPNSKPSALLGVANTHAVRYVRPTVTGEHAFSSSTLPVLQAWDTLTVYILANDSVFLLASVRV